MLAGQKPYMLAGQERHPSTAIQPTRPWYTRNLLLVMVAATNMEVKCNGNSLLHMPKEARNHSIPQTVLTNGQCWCIFQVVRLRVLLICSRRHTLISATVPTATATSKAQLAQVCLLHCRHYSTPAGQA